MTDEPGYEDGEGEPDALEDGGGAGSEVIASDAKTFAILCHLSPLVGASFVGPLIVWLIKKDEPFVDDQGKEALNFQITIAGIALVLGIVSCFPPALLLTIPLDVILVIFMLIFMIIAAMKCSDGTRYRYPMTIRLIK